MNEKKSQSTKPTEKILNLNPDNITEAKKILKTLKRNSFIDKVNINTLKDEKSLKILKESGFFNLNFLNNSKPLSSLNITQDDIEDVFRLINKNKNGKKITLKDLKENMSTLNPRIPESEIPILINEQDEMSSEELFKLLNDCDYKDFDPVNEVFRMLDIHNINAVDIDRLMYMMHKFGFRNIDKNDKEILLECLDMNQDGMISLEDMRQVLERGELDLHSNI